MTTKPNLLPKYLNQKQQQQNNLKTKSQEAKSPNSKITSTRMSRRTIMSTNLVVNNAPTATLDEELYSKNFTTKSETITQHKSRRMAFSIDRKQNSEQQQQKSFTYSTSQTRKIEKKDISCPFRCSSIDLNMNNNNNQESSDQKYKNNNVYVPHQKVENNLQNKPALARSVSGSLTSLSNMDPSSNINGKPVASPKQQQQQVKLTSAADLLDFVKKLLIEYNVPASKNLIQVLIDYINQYESLDKFERALLESETERKKLIAFIAASNAALISRKNNAQLLYNSLSGKFLIIFTSTKSNNVEGLDLFVSCLRFRELVYTSVLLND
jgi:hypothetical protein